MEFFNTAVQFQKLEKIEIGGLRGKALTHNVENVLKEFKELYSVFSISSYDSLDPEDSGFLSDYKIFNTNIVNLDRKLGAILCRAFEDCIVSESVFKLLNVFGNLIERKIINRDLTDKIPSLLQMLNSELDAVNDILVGQKKRVFDFGKPLMDRNMPPVSGQINFAEEMRDRTVKCVESFRAVSHPVVESKEAVIIFDKYSQLLKALEIYEDKVYNTWALTAEKKTNKETNKLTRSLYSRFVLATAQLNLSSNKFYLDI